jgi:FKBP-type peptidyl-prolyl cis-trans isomerase
VFFDAATVAAAGATALIGGQQTAHAATSNGLPLTASPSGLKWADAKVGSGQPVKIGAAVSIDYSIASTAGRFPQIYTTKDKGQPYRWTLGDGSTIEGIEKAIIGDEKEGIPPMLPGGIRRVIVPSSLGYEKLSKANAKCIDGESGSIGPIPPKSDLGAYQRYVQQEEGNAYLSYVNKCKQLTIFLRSNVQPNHFSNYQLVQFLL